MRVDVLVDELERKVVDLAHHVLLGRVDHVEGGRHRLEANGVPTHEADEDLEGPRVDVLQLCLTTWYFLAHFLIVFVFVSVFVFSFVFVFVFVFSSVFVFVFVLTWMLINRPLSSASGPSSIALNTGLLG